jgi:hypothetical protein
LAIVELLLAYGADLNARTCDSEKWNDTPLEFAFRPTRKRTPKEGVARRYPLSAAALLVERGASVSGSAAKMSKALGLDSILEAFAESPGLWDAFVAGKSAY